MTTALCIGGHLLEGIRRDAFWRDACLSFFDAVGQPLERAANSRGTIVPVTPKLREQLFQRDAWECYAHGEDAPDLAERLRWSAAFHVDFGRRMLFIGLDASVVGAGETLLRFFEEKILPGQAGVRYAYQFERERTRGPQSYVVGVRESTRSRDYLAKDELLMWWGNRLALGQDDEVVRDAFEHNYFLARADNALLARIETVAAEIGRIERQGDYAIWRLDVGQCDAARQRLIELGLIGPARWQAH